MFWNGSAQEEEQGTCKYEIRQPAEERHSAGVGAETGVDDECHESDDGRVHEE